MTPADVGLVREAGGLGDVLRLGSVARALKRRGTRCVTAYTLWQYKEVIEHLRGIDEFTPVQLPSLRLRRPRSTNWRQAPYLLRSIRSGHDRLIDCFCPGYVYEMRSDPVVMDRAEVFCIAGGIVVDEGEDLAPQWIVTPEESASADSLLPEGPTIGIAIQATDPARTYPRHLTLRLIELLRDEGFEVVIIDRDQKFSSELPVRMIVGESFTRVAAALPKLKCVVAVCSGILHLCGALDVPCVGLFGPTDAQVMCKHYPNHRTLVADGYTDREGSPCGQPCWFKPQRGWDQARCRPNGCYWINRILPEDIVKEVMYVARIDPDVPLPD